MTVSLSLDQILAIHEALCREFGGRAGILDLGALEAATARFFDTFDGEDLYPDLPAKAAALLHLLVPSHPGPGRRFSCTEELPPSSSLRRLHSPRD